MERSSGCGKGPEWSILSQTKKNKYEKQLKFQQQTVIKNHENFEKKKEFIIIENIFIFISLHFNVTSCVTFKLDIGYLHTIHFIKQKQNGNRVLNEKRIKTELDVFFIKFLASKNIKIVFNRLFVVSRL